MEKLINKWLEEGTINQQQAEKMLQDVVTSKKEATSNKLIVSASLTGSVLLGLGAIMLIASNWQTMSSWMKVAVMMGSTFASYITGYNLKYDKSTLPKVGSSLLFLSCMLFGASIFLITQIYHVNANKHYLLLIWLAGLMPLVYTTKLKPITCLATIIFFVWIPSFIFQNMSPSMAFKNFFAFPAMYMFSAILLFAIGGFHYAKKALEGVGYVYRIIAIQVIVLCLFLLTFNTFSGNHGGIYGGSFRIAEQMAKVSGQFKNWTFIIGLMGVIGCTLNYGLGFSRTKTEKFELGAAFVLFILGLLLIFIPPQTNIYMIAFNIIFSGFLGVLIYFGYKFEDAHLLNMGMRYLSGFLFFKYFDLFWDLFPRSMFFIIGGLVLVYGGIFMEKKRNELNKKFNKQQAT